MSWAEVSLNCPRALADRYETVLEECGALAITLQDSADNPVLEPAPGATPLWPGVLVRGLFPIEIDRGQVSAALLVLDGIHRPDQLAWRDVKDQDWERAWMDQFRPMKFGEHLWIVPSGMQGPDDPHAVQLHLDPGLAFGTGTHPTTAMCLRWIDAHDFDDRDVLDFGCGSGVLGIAAALKGARSVICVDNDPQALEASTNNAERNEVTSQITCMAPEEAEDIEVDVVLANILSGPLIKLAPLLQRMLSAGGEIVLSGVLKEQAEDVIRAYEKCCGRLQTDELEEWVCLHGHRRVVGETID